MPRKQKKYHYIYKTTNIITGKYYIGMHSTNDLNDGYIGSGKRLWYSINKYGKENHKFEILEFFSDRKSLKKREAELVNEDLLQDPMCMNLTLGGCGGFEFLNKNSDLQREKAKKSAIKQKWLRENDLEWVKRKSEKISKSMKQQYIDGNRKNQLPSWKGKKHKEETKQKISKAKRGKCSGKNNPQYGTKWAWINKGNKVLKIPLKELNEYLLNGWERGIKKKTQIINICESCNKKFKSKNSFTRFCSNKCRYINRPNEVRENFDKLYNAYIKYGSLCKAFKHCNIIRSKNRYDTFFEILNEK